MFKEFLSGFTKFFTSDKVLILVVFLVLVIGLSMYSGSKKSKYDAMTSKVSSINLTPAAALGNTSESSPANVDNSETITGGDMDMGMSNITESYTNASESEDTTGLLPNDQNSQWASLNPVSGGNIAAPDLLQAGFNIGLDTIGQTLRNPNYQLRSDPIITKQNVGPWMQSTIEPDLGRIPLEIGM